MTIMSTCRGGFARKRKNNIKAGVHQPHREIVTFTGKYVATKQSKKHAHYSEQLPIEADTTRWWLQEQGRWLGSDIAEKVRVFVDESEETKEIFVYPIFDDPTLLAADHATDYYLGFDAKIYCMTEDGYEPFTTDEHSMQPEVKYLVKQLRRMRRK